MFEMQNKQEIFHMYVLLKMKCVQVDTDLYAPGYKMLSPRLRQISALNAGMDVHY